MDHTSSHPTPAPSHLTYLCNRDLQTQKPVLDLDITGNQLQHGRGERHSSSPAIEG